MSIVTIIMTVVTTSYDPLSSRTLSACRIDFSPRDPPQATIALPLAESQHRPYYRTLNPKPYNGTLNPKPYNRTLNPKPYNGTLNPKPYILQNPTIEFYGKLRRESHRIWLLPEVTAPGSYP